nr:hypothetical protein [Pseudopedobacter sp.]
MTLRHLLSACFVFIASASFAQKKDTTLNDTVKKRKNGIAMTTGLAVFSLADGGFSSYSTNAAGENGLYYRRDFGKSWYLQTELNFQRKFTNVPVQNESNKIRVMEQLVQFPVSVFVGNPTRYNAGAINYSFGVGVYISKPTKQEYRYEADFSKPNLFVPQTNYYKAGFLFDTTVLFNATEKATVNIGFRSTFDSFSIKPSSVNNTYLFRSYLIYIGSAFRW